MLKLHVHQKVNVRWIQRSAKRFLPMIPIVDWTVGERERAYDIFSRLLKERIICIMGPVWDIIKNQQACFISWCLLSIAAQHTKHPCPHITHLKTFHQSIGMFHLSFSLHYKCIFRNSKLCTMLLPPTHTPREREKPIQLWSLSSISGTLTNINSLCKNKIKEEQWVRLLVQFRWQHFFFFIKIIWFCVFNCCFVL